MPVKVALYTCMLERNSMIYLISLMQTAVRNVTVSMKKL